MRAFLRLYTVYTYSLQWKSYDFVGAGGAVPHKGYRKNTEA